jgi:uncharacterized OsmC-like protein
MDVRTMQEPLKAGYRRDPESGKITLTARGGQADGPIACSVDLGRAVYEAQAHAGVGGAGTGACSGDLLLGALAACAQITCQMVAGAMGLDVRAIAVTAEGDLNLRGTLLLRRHARAHRPTAGHHQLELTARRSTMASCGSSRPSLSGSSSG